MKKIIIGIIALTSISASALECEVGRAEKKVSLAKSGYNITRADGVSYIVKYDINEEYVSLAIEGGVENMNATTESFGAKRSYLSLGKKGDFSDIAISCER